MNCATGTTERGGALQITNRGMGRVGVIRPEGLDRGAVTTSGRSVELIPLCVQRRCSEKRAIRSSLLPTQMSSPTRMAELTRCIAAV